MSQTPSLRQQHGVQRGLLALLGAGVLAWLTWRSRFDLQRVLAGADPAWLLLAVLLGVALTILQGLLFSSLVNKHGRADSRKQVVAAFMLSQPGKYIPGKVWSALMQSLALRQDIGLARITIANIEMALITILQMTALGLACLRPTSLFIVTCTLIAGLVLTIAIVCMPTAALLARAMPWLAKRMRLGPELDGARREGIGYIALIGFAGLTVNFAASWSVLHAAGPAVSDSALMPVLASLYLGFAASILAIPVPAGIGVREAAAAGLGSLLAPGVAPALIISVALLARGWQLAVDVACFCIGSLLLRSKAVRRP